MQRRLDPETGVNKPFENVFMSGAYSQCFSGKMHQFSSLFKRRVFLTDLNFSNLRNKNDFRKSGGMLPQQIFEHLHTAMAILVLFELFLRKVCHTFGP